jgi:hypothetical protein
MMTAMLFVVSALKLITEVALMALLGQGVLAVLAGNRRESNVVYKILRDIASPFVRLSRIVSPHVVLDRHLPLVTFLLLACGWIAVTLVKIDLCMHIGVELCK